MNIKTTLSVALLALFGGLAPAWADNSTIKFVGSALAYSESFSLKQILDDLEGGEAPLSGNKAFMKLKAGIEYRFDKHQLGIYSRRETLIKHTQGVADFLYLDKNDIPFPDPGFYDIRLDVDDIQFKEFQYAYHWRLDDSITLVTGLSLIYADDLIKGSLNGDMSSENAFSGQEFSWNAYLDYYYREDQLLNRPNVKPPHAYGFSSYFGLDWQPTKNLNVGLQIQDAFSSVYWRNAPFTQARSNVSDAISIRQPAVSGTVGYKRIVQRIDPFLIAEAKLALQSNDYLLLRSESVFGQAFNYLGLEFEREFGSLAFQACLETHALAIALSTDYISVGVASDSLVLRNAHHANLIVELNVAF